MRTVSFSIRGRVQGVWYRGWAGETARRLGIDGWVRNCADGSVEVRAVGPEAAIDGLIRVCHQGPPAARVERVEITEQCDGDPHGLAGRGFHSD